MKRPSLRSPVLILCIVSVQLYGYVLSAEVGTHIPREPYTADARTLIYRKFENLVTPEHANHDPIVANNAGIADSVLDKRAYAHALLEKVLSAQRFLESLDALTETDLPVGVAKSGGEADYSILIDRMRFTKEGALMDVYASLALPQAGARIAFHGQVPLSANGGIAGKAKLFLLGDHAIRLNATTMLSVKGTEASYVEFDCNGFVGVNLVGELEFTTDLIVPENEQGQPQAGRLKVTFVTYTQSLNDILLSISIPPFQVRGLYGFGFYVTKAYLDWSDFSNPEGLVFPRQYSSPVVDAGLGELWQGIYLHELAVRLPPAFNSRSSADRISFGAQGAILDDQGLTGEVYVENLVADGNMNGWIYTLDKAALELIANQVTGFSLEGKLSIPVVKGRNGDPAAFSYIAQRGADGDYVFSVDVEEDLKLELWAADIRLAKGSNAVVRERDNKFYPSASLSGELTINLLGKGPKARFNSIRFENMIIDSEAPYFKPGSFGFGKEGTSSSISKYPVVINNVNFRSQKLRVGIAFDLIINISGKPEEESFAGKAGLVIWGTQDEKPLKDKNENVIGIDQYSWRFDNVELTGVKISIKKPKVIELTGEVQFFDNDGIYGEGFKGFLKGKIQSIKVEAEALFGRTETFRYWYADALVELKTGIPIVPGALSAFGFGGGYYSRMKQSDKPVWRTLGRPPSGISYVPDENTVGIRAVVLIGTPRPQAMSGDVALEVSINRHGGINAITFTGNAKFMSPATSSRKQIMEMASAAVAGNLTEQLSSLGKGQVYGSVRLHFDNVNEVFHGNLEIYINVAGGMVRGVSEGNKAGWAVMHFEQKEWYILIGTPDQPLGLEVARIFKSKSYFMLGKNLPGSPPPPPQVSEILGDIDLDYMRDMNALESGMGIAFGMHFIVDTGDLRFLIFYGRFSAGTGLDFMLKDYGNDYHCAGATGPMGINGWYANGQAYAFVMGKIGVKVNLRFYKGTYDILSIGAAAILQAKGPNPFWMKGTVGGYYKILGGLVKGKCRFEVTVGKDCKPVGEENVLDEIDIIAGITPANSSTSISVFNTPQVAFNIPIGEVFDVTDMENRRHYFRAALDEFVVLDGTRRLNGTLIWNDEHDVVVFDAADLLPAKRRLKAKARLTFEENVQGEWRKVKFDSRIVEELAESNFETAEAPAYIPQTNIAVSYPLSNHVNFYPKEHTEGFIQLKDGQPYLFRPGSEWVQKVRITESVSGRSTDTDLHYNPLTARITFTMPAGFENTRTYRLEVVNIPKQPTVIDGNISKVQRELNLDAAAGSATVTTQTLEGNVDGLEVKSIYSTTFRTSRYNTFTEKMQYITIGSPIRLSQGINVFRLSSRLQGDECFEAAEIIGSAGVPKLIEMEAVTAGNPWFERYVYPLVYEGYPLLGWMQVSRPDPEHLGIPPVRDIYIEDAPSAAGLPFAGERLVYNLGQTVARDFYDLQRRAVNYIADFPGGVNTRLAALVTSPMPQIRYGPYRIRMSYVIPGINKVTSSYELEMFNSIPDND